MRRLLLTASALLLIVAGAAAQQPSKPGIKKIGVGAPAPAFKIQDPSGKVIDLAELTAKGPVLVRLTCGCSGCDKELAYFQAIHKAYQNAGLVTVAIFREPDTKVAAYVKEKKLDMLYAVDTKGQSWQVFETKTMPTNFLIDKGGKVLAIASGCDPSGLLAKRLSEKVAQTVQAKPVDVKKQVEEHIKAGK